MGGALTTSVALGGSSWSVLPQPDGRVVSSGVITVAKDTAVTTADLGVIRYQAF